MKRNYEFYEWNELNFATKVANFYEFGSFVPIRTLASQILYQIRIIRVIRS